MSKATNSGIITDEASGERHIPESVRADGSTRKAIKIRPGYKPPEDVELYRNRAAASFRERAKRMGVPGTAGLKDEKTEQPASSASASISAPAPAPVPAKPSAPTSTTPASASNNKNAKRREARKKAKAEDNTKQDETPKQETIDPEVEREKKARGLKKKLKQAKDLRNKKEQGEGLLPEQIAKVIKINELIRELDALGFDAEGEPQKGGKSLKTKEDAGESKA